MNVGVARRPARGADASSRARPGSTGCRIRTADPTAGWMGVVDLDLTADVVDLTAALVDIESVSRNEQAIADAVEAALTPLPHLDVVRRGHTVVARTDLGRGERVVIAGHLDTVPLNDNLPSRNDGTHLHGLGACDMKGGDARHPASSPRPSRSRSATSPTCSTRARRSRASSTAWATSRDRRARPAAGRLRDPDGAVGRRGRGRLPGHDAGRGHDVRRARPLAPGPGRASTRSTGAAPVLERLTAYEPRMPVIDGLTYHEGLNAVGISGGVAGNVLPDRCTVIGQLPVRARPQRGRGRGVPARLLRRVRRAGRRQRARAPCPASTGRRPRSSSRRSAAR